MKANSSCSQGAMRLATLLGFILCTASPLHSQIRYSANVVAYHEVIFAAGSNLVANPFDAGNNTVSNLFPDLPDGSFLLFWDASNQRFGPPNFFTAGTGWTDGSAQLQQPAGAFLWLPASKPVTFVGQPWPPGCVTFQAGQTLSSVPPLLACALCDSLDDCPLIPPDSSFVLQWDRVSQSFVPNQFLPELGWFPATPSFALDEAGLVYTPLALEARAPGFFPPGSTRLFNPIRTADAFTFQLGSQSALTYSVQQCSNLATGSWHTILTETATPTGGVITVTVPAPPNGVAFFRLHEVRLLDPSRTGDQFQFQFYAEDGIRYQISRTSSLTNPSWEPVTMIRGTGARVTAVDPAAFWSTAFYRVEY